MVLDGGRAINEVFTLAKSQPNMEYAIKMSMLEVGTRLTSIAISPDYCEWINLLLQCVVVE